MAEFVENCTSESTPVDCYYAPGQFWIHAYYNGGKLYLKADGTPYIAEFIVH